MVQQHPSSTLTEDTLLCNNDESRMMRSSAFQRRVKKRAMALFALFGATVVVLCALLAITTHSTSSGEEVELTELPDGKSYMMGILRDRVRALRGHGEGKFDGVVDKSQDKMIAKLYGGYNKESPAESLSARFEQAAAGVGTYNLPALNVPPPANVAGAALSASASPDANLKIQASGLSADPEIRRSAQLESDKAFQLFQQQQPEGSGSPMLFQTGAEELLSQNDNAQQALQQLPPVQPVAPAAAPAPPAAPMMPYGNVAPIMQPQQPYAAPYQQPPMAPYQAAPQSYPMSPVSEAAPPPAQEDVDDGGLLAPSFVSPPTPQLPVQLGCSGVSFQVEALGLHASDFVTISLMPGAPFGAILTQQTSGVNPGTAVFNWTPTRTEYNELEYQICFTATDSHHLSRNKCVSLILNVQCANTAPLQAIYPQGAVPPAGQQPPAPPPPAYGQQPPAYGQQPPAYGQQPPAYGQQPPAYGQQPPAYGQQPPAYGQQPPAYGQQPPVYGQQPPAYGQQPPAYGQQPPAYGQQPPMNEANAPAPHADCAPLFMYINKDLNDHFYTTNFKELYGGKLHYNFEGVMTGVYAVEHPGTIPVYRYFDDKTLNHVYTLNYHEWGKGDDIKTPEGERGHTYEGVAFYVYQTPRQGLKPIYMWLDAKKNTMFSMTRSKAGPASKGFKLVGRIGYAACSPK